MKDRFSVVLALLLALNGIFLYFNWQNKTNSLPQQNLSDELLKVSELEFSYVLSKSKSYPADPRKPISVQIFVHENQCSLCKEESKPYWKTLSEMDNINFRICYYARQVRGWERFALWMELPKEQILPVYSIASEDTLFWASSAPSVIVVDNQTKEVKLAHAGSSHLRKRSILFYESLIQYFSDKNSTKPS
jgi:hypothetical protein